MNLRRQKGFSLIELMIAISILAIILAMAVPSLSSYMDHRRVINVAETLYGQLQYARSEAIARSEIVYANFSSNDTTDWAMGISTRFNCDVTKATPAITDDCILIVDDGDGTLDTGDGTTDTGDLLYNGMSSVDYPRITLGDGDNTTNPDGIQFTFDPVRGTVANFETVVIKFNNPNGNSYEMRIVPFATGRMRVCSPNGNSKVPGYTAC